MRTIVPMTVLAAAFVCSLGTAPANARARVFVASYGSDSNPCTFLSPCRNFQQAVNVVDAGGEVTAIDSAGFGSITITQAVTITSPDGVEAGIVPAAGGNGITINAGPTDAVVLRGLTLNGSGVGTRGIVFNSGGSLTVIDCVVQNFVSDGIDFFPTVASKLSVSNTTAVNNGNTGILVLPIGSGAVEAVFDRVQAKTNAETGIALNGTNSTGTLKGTVYESVASENGNVNISGTGFVAVTLAGHAPTTLMVFHSVSSNQGVGIVAQGVGATIRLANSTITSNHNNSWETVGNGFVLSYGDNYIDGNGDGDPTPPLTARK